MEELNHILSQIYSTDNEVQAHVCEQIVIYKSDPSLLPSILELIMNCDALTKNAAAVIFKYNFNTNYSEVSTTEGFQAIKDNIINIIRNDSVLSVKEILIGTLLDNVKEEILEWPEIIELLEHLEDLTSIDFALSLALSLYEVLKLNELQQFAENFLNIITTALQIESPSRNLSFKTSKLISRTVHIIPTESISETPIQEYAQILLMRFAEQYNSNENDCIQSGLLLEFSLNATTPLFDVEELLQSLVTMALEEENDYKWVPMSIIGRIIKTYGSSISDHFPALFELSINVATEIINEDFTSACIILRVVKRIAQHLSPSNFLEFLEQINESLTGNEITSEFIYCTLLILDITIEVFGENVIIIQNGVLPILMLCFESDSNEILEKTAETAKEVAAYSGSVFDLSGLFAKIVGLTEVFASDEGDADKLSEIVGYISRFIFSAKLSAESIVGVGTSVIGWIGEFGVTPNFIYCLVECISALSPHFKVLSSPEDPAAQLALSSYEVSTEILSYEESPLVPPAVELIGALVASASSLFDEQLQTMLDVIAGQLQLQDVDHLDAAYTALIRITRALGTTINPYIEAGLIRAGDVMTHIERYTTQLICLVCDFVRASVRKEADGIERWAPALILFLSVLASTETDVELYGSAMSSLMALAISQGYDTDDYLEIAQERVENGGEWAAISFAAMRYLIKKSDDLEEDQISRIFSSGMQVITRSLPVLSKSGRVLVNSQQFPDCVREAYRMLAALAAHYHSGFDIGAYLEAVAFPLGSAEAPVLAEEPSDNEKVVQLAPIIAYLSGENEVELAAGVLPRTIELISNYDCISDPAPIELGRAVGLVYDEAVGTIIESVLPHMSTRSPISDRIRAAVGSTILSLWLKHPQEIGPAASSVLQMLPTRGSRENVINVFNAVLQAAESLPDDFAAMLETVRGFITRSFDAGFIYSLGLPEDTVSLMERLKGVLEGQNNYV